LAEQAQHGDFCHGAKDADQQDSQSAHAILSLIPLPIQP
jgi:hypothetical protein